MNISPITFTSRKLTQFPEFTKSQAQNRRDTSIVYFPGEACTVSDNAQSIIESEMTAKNLLKSYKTELKKILKRGRKNNFNSYSTDSMSVLFFSSDSDTQLPEKIVCFSFANGMKPKREYFIKDEKNFTVTDLSKKDFTFSLTARDGELTGLKEVDKGDGEIRELKIDDNGSHHYVRKNNGRKIRNCEIILKHDGTKDICERIKDGSINTYYLTSKTGYWTKAKEAYL